MNSWAAGTLSSSGRRRNLGIIIFSIIKLKMLIAFNMLKYKDKHL
jgi:hypothetical protein